MGPEEKISVFEFQCRCCNRHGFARLNTEKEQTAFVQSGLLHINKNDTRKAVSEYNCVFFINKIDNFGIKSLCSRNHWKVLKKNTTADTVSIKSHMRISNN